MVVFRCVIEGCLWRSGARWGECCDEFLGEEEEGYFGLCGERGGG